MVQIQIQPNSRGLYEHAYPTELSHVLTKPQFDAFLKGLNRVQTGFHRAGIYLVISLFSGGVAAVLMYLFGASNRILAGCFVAFGLAVGLAVSMVENLLYRLEREQLVLLITSYNNQLSSKGVVFDMRVIQPADDMIAEGFSELIGATEILITYEPH